MKTKRIGLVGYYGNLNFGDDIIYLQLIQEINSLTNKNAEFCFFGGPYFRDIEENIYSSYEILPMCGHFWKKLLKCDLVVFAGGGLFHSFGRTIYLYCAFIIILKLFRKKILFYSVGIGPLKGFPRFLFLFCSRLIHKQSVRDRESLNYSPHAKLNIDLGVKWLSKNCPYDPLRGRGVICCLRWLKNENYHFGKIETNDILLSFFNNVHDEKIDFCIAHPWRDSSLIKLIDENHFKYFEMSKPSIAIELVSKYSVVISMRLHVILLGIFLGKTVIPVIYDEKIINVLNSLNVHWDKKLYFHDLDKIEMKDLPNYSIKYDINEIKLIVGRFSTLELGEAIWGE